MKFYRVFKWTALMSIISISSSVSAENAIYNNGYKTPGNSAVSTEQSHPSTNLKPNEYNGVQPSNDNNSSRTSTSTDYNNMGPNINPYRESRNGPKSHSQPMRYNGMGPVSYNHQPVRYRGQANYPRSQQIAYNQSYNSQPIRVSNPQYTTNSGRVVRNNGQVTYQDPSQYYNTNGQPVRYQSQNYNTNSQPVKYQGQSYNPPQPVRYQGQSYNPPQPVRYQDPSYYGKGQPVVSQNQADDSSNTNDVNQKAPMNTYDTTGAKQAYNNYKKNLINSAEEPDSTNPKQEAVQPKPASSNSNQQNRTMGEENKPANRDQQDPPKQFQPKPTSYRVTTPNKPIAEDAPSLPKQQEKQKPDETQPIPPKAASLGKTNFNRSIADKKADPENSDQNEQNKKNQLQRDINNASYKKSTYFRNKRNTNKNIAEADVNNPPVPQKTKQSMQPQQHAGASYNNPGFLDVETIPAPSNSQNRQESDNDHPANYFPQEKRNLLEVAKDNPNLSVFVSALEATGLDQKLKEEGPYTIFAPSNDAFKQLPRGALERLMKPENQRQLFLILSYHIVPGKLVSKDIKTTSVKTISGKDLNVEVSRGNINIDDAEVVKADLPASNGVIHIIDEVMLPN